MLKYKDDMPELYELCTNEGVALESGRIYHIFPEFAREKLLYISNHGIYKPKRIAVNYENRKNLVIDGKGAKLVMHGMVLPFALENCENLQIRNLQIVFEDGMILEAEVLEAEEDRVLLQFAEPEKCLVKDGNLRYRGYHGLRALRDYSEIEVSQNGGKIAENWGDGCFGVSLRRCKAEKQGDCVEIKGVKRLPQKGSTVLFRFGEREAPAVFLNRCKNVRLENIIVNSAPGMGVIAQNCTDITCVDCRVEPEEGRWSSTNFDAMHFVGCSGRIAVENCRFLHQMDDGLNIHGVYTTVERAGGNRLLLKYNHSQQKGVDLFQAGDELLLRNREDLQPVCRVTVKMAEVLNRDYTLLTLKESGSEIREGMLAENLTKSPEVLVKNCIFSQNRARGMLIAARGKAVIEDNRIEVPGAGILLECDSYYWFESGAVCDLTVRRNHFMECGYRREWGKAAVSTAHPGKTPEGFYYHENICIEENVFEDCDAVAEMISVDGITIGDNSIIERKTEQLKERNRTVVKKSEKSGEEDVSEKFPGITLIHCRNEHIGKQNFIR